VTVRVAVGETTGASIAAREASVRDTRQAQAAREVQADPFVQDLISLFDGKIVETSHRDKPASQDT
jgi:hypothetical protein